MAIVKQDHQLEKAVFSFDEAGDVLSVELTVNIQVIGDDIDTRVRMVKNVWDDLTPGQKTQGDAVGKKLKSLAEAF